MAAAASGSKRSLVEVADGAAVASEARDAAGRDIDGFIVPLLARLSPEDKAQLASRAPWLPLTSDERDRLRAHPFFLTLDEKTQFLDRVRAYEATEADIAHDKPQCRVFCFCLVFDASKEGGARLTWAAPFPLRSDAGQKELPVMPDNALVCREIVQL